MFVSGATLAWFEPSDGEILTGARWDPAFYGCATRVLRMGEPGAAGAKFPLLLCDWGRNVAGLEVSLQPSLPVFISAFLGAVGGWSFCSRAAPGSDDGPCRCRTGTGEFYFDCADARAWVHGRSVGANCATAVRGGCRYGRV